jgi:hypothetical protein
MPSDITGLMGLLATAQTPAAHKTSHENGGADEISVSGLSGVLADPQTPSAHAITDHTGFPGGTTNFLRSDGTFAAPAGGPGGGVTRIDIPIVTNAFAWTNMPAADTELAGSAFARFKVDLTGFNEYRFKVTVNVVGAAGADLRVQYSTDDSTFADLSGEIDISTLGRKVTAWGALPAGAKADVFLRVMGKQGNGAADPNLSQIRLEVRQ